MRGPSGPLPLEAARKTCRPSGRRLSTWGAEGGTGLLPLPEEDMCRELAPIPDVGSLEPLDGESCSPKVAFHVRLEEHWRRVVVRRVALLLEDEKEVGETLYLRREPSNLALLPACVASPTVRQGSVGQAPAPGVSVGSPDQSVGTAVRQAVEERVVDRAHGTAQVGLQRPPAAGGELLLGGDEKIRGLQDASPPRRTW